ncbi:MAG TPA: hypothetical protein VGP61_07790 [Gemmatimonadales bacterium]|jgi:hypothetical protein|nr:hypothetical protein [Gemmatimonadales bacterium]
MTAIARTTGAVVLAAALIASGLIWDIAWHRSVGRDTFWTAPHLLEYLAALLVAVSCGWLILRHSFGSATPERERMVRFWGFRGPLGAWVCVWGSLAMLVSAPFDNWWHNAYGLDVRIVSPPHLLLGVGMVAIVLGAMLMALAEQNNAAGRESRVLASLFAIAAALLVLTRATMTMEYTGFPNLWRSRLFYLISAASFPVLLAAVARAGRLRWPATATAALFMLFSLLLSWVLQYVPATPRLAPINNPVTHLVAAPFPVLLVVPALLFDLLHRALGDRRDWWLAGLLGVGFVIVLLAVSWPAAAFLLSPAARNPLFLADQWDYSARLGPWRYEYWDAITDRRLLRAGSASLLKPFLFALLLGVLSSRVGLALGSWMRKVRR